MLVIYVPSLDKIFDTVPLALIDFGYIFGGALIMFLFGMVANYIIRRLTKELD